VAEDADDLFDELEADQSPTRTQCSIGALLATLEDRAQWDAAFANPKYSGASLVRALKRRGYKVTEQPVLRHTRAMRIGSGCQCPKI
jgi:hypothetical protein